MANQEKNSKFKLWFDDSIQVIRGETSGELDEETANRIKETTFKLLEQRAGVTDMLVNVSNAGTPKARSRQILAELTQHPKCGRIAYFGGPAVIRVVVNLIIAASRKKNDRHFKSEQEALEWLKK